MILSIDPGIANLGWATDTGLGGTQITTPDISLNRRICDMSYGLYQLVQHTPPGLVLVEDTFGPLVKPTTMLLGGLMAVFKESKFLLVSPGKWIRDLFGSGHRGEYKKLTRELVTSLGIKYNTQHHADAVGLLEWYKKYGHIKKVPGAKRKAKRKPGLRASPAKAPRSNPRRPGTRR